MNVLVIIPTYNERGNLPVLARQILDGFPYRVLVVDDQSPDGTGELADAIAREYPGRLEVLHRAGERGLGLSYVDGFKRALETDADLICQMDADFSHDPRYLPDLVAAAATYDLVLGSRYLNGVSVVNWPLRRIVLSIFANWYVRTITGLRINDVTGGFRCWRRQALQRLQSERIRSRRYAFMVETVFEAARLGLHIGESPIIFVERREGASKMSGSVLAESMVFPWRLVLRNGGRVSRTREVGRP
jgi:dolichol-phosphate mannosyltransferase